MKKHGYIAGALFNEGEIAQRISEGKALREMMPEVEWYNPIEAPVNDKSKLPTAKDIFSLDTDYVLKSDYILADLSREDLGVAMELGISIGVEISRKIIESELQKQLENLGLTCNCKECKCSNTNLKLTEEERGELFSSFVPKDIGVKILKNPMYKNLDSRGKKQFEDIVEQSALMFNDESISQEDKEKVLMAIQDAFFDAKQKNKKKK